MNGIVIVEDRLGRAISLAEQFSELSEEHPEFNIQVSCGFILLQVPEMSLR